MNREILFKGKRADNGEWVDGNLLKLKSDNRGYVYYIIPEITNGSWCKSNFALKFISPCYEVDPITVCQYTGLKDKNGHKIWENDIVRCGGKLLISWSENKASWVLDKTGWLYSHFFGESVEPEDVEVIGNVFDNPELFEVDHE